MLLAALALVSCASPDAPKTETPLETLKAYIQAIKKKDPTQMKMLLSKGSLKMAEDEAKAQNTTVDEVIKRETLFTENQTQVEFKNQKIDGERATIEVKNSFGSWDIVPFNKEDGEWKIAKDRFMEEQMKKIDEDNKKLDEQINQGFPDTGNTTLPNQTNPTLPPPGGFPDTTTTAPAPMPTMQEMKTPAPTP
jgi:hypothetical protein